MNLHDAKTWNDLINLLITIDQKDNPDHTLIDLWDKDPVNLFLKKQQNSIDSIQNATLIELSNRNVGQWSANKDTELGQLFLQRYTRLVEFCIEHDVGWQQSSFEKEVQNKKVFQIDDDLLNIDLGMYMEKLITSTFSFNVERRPKIRFEGPHGSGKTISMFLYLAMNLITDNQHTTQQLVLTESMKNVVHTHLRTLMYLILIRAGEYLNTIVKKQYKGTIDLSDSSIFRIMDDKFKRLFIHTPNDLTLDQVSKLPQRSRLYIECIDHLTIPLLSSSVIQVIGGGWPGRENNDQTLVFETRQSIPALGDDGTRNIVITPKWNSQETNPKAAVLDMKKLTNLMKKFES